MQLSNSFDFNSHIKKKIFFLGTDFDFTRLNYWYFELRRFHGTAQSFLPLFT